METTTQVSKADVQFNEHGFLTDFQEWNRNVAEEMAAEEGLPLTECHWIAIDFLREYYNSYEVPPSPRVVLHTIGERIGKHGACSRKDLEKLFPNGGCKQACRLAGLPRHYCHAC